MQIGCPRKLVILLLTATISVSGAATLSGCREQKPEDGPATQESPELPKKPVIYLYPEETQQITVALDLSGELEVTYPQINFTNFQKNRGEWTVTASPNGTLVDNKGRAYHNLFWEGKMPLPLAKTGTVVARDEVVPFFENALTQQGLTDKEAAEFITYWAPLMQSDPWYIVSFRGREYTERAKLDISPQPDHEIRVFMTYRGYSVEPSIAPQIVSPINREKLSGFIAVEWGGSASPDPQQH